jgi:hypothetical protein
MARFVVLHIFLCCEWQVKLRKLPKSKDWKKIKSQFNALQQDKQHIDKLLNKQKGRRPHKQNYLLAHFLIKN